MAQAQWKVEDLLLEVQHLEKLQEKPRGQNIMSQMVASLEQKLKAIPNLTPTIVVKLMDAVDESKLDSDTKEKVLKCMDTLSGPASHLRLQSTQQGVANLSMYLSSTDWKKLGMTTLSADVHHTLVVRLKKIGLVSLKEDVKGQAIGITMAWMESKGMGIPGPWELYYSVGDFARVFTQTKSLAKWDLW